MKLSSSSMGRAAAIAVILSAMPCLSAFSEKPEKGKDTRLTNPHLQKTDNNDTVSIEAKNMDILELLKLLSQQTGISIAAGQNVRGFATLRLDNVKADDALKIVASACGLALEQKNNAVVVTTAQEYETSNGRPFGSSRCFEVIELVHAKAKDVYGIVKNIKTQAGFMAVDEIGNRILVCDSLPAMTDIKRAAGCLDKPLFRKMFFIRHAKAQAVCEYIGRTALASASFSADEPSNTVYVEASEEAVRRIASVIEALDKASERQTRVFSLRYADCDECVKVLKPLLTPDSGLIEADKRSRRLIIKDTQPMIEAAGRIIRELDAEPACVLIEARIVQVDMEDAFSLGVNWQLVYERLSKEAQQATVTSAFGQIKGSPAPPNGPHFKPDVKYVPLHRDGFDTLVNRGATAIITGSVRDAKDPFAAVVQALGEFGSVRMLASPRIAVLDGIEAKIQVGTREPYVTSTVVQGQSAATTAENVTFIDVGVLLSVMPRVSSDGTVTMKIRPEVSSVSRNFVSGQGNAIPVVSTQTVDTMVKVDDNAALILGGLITVKKTRRYEKIPVLGDIPVAGIPFRRKEERETASELVIIMRPSVMSSGARDNAAFEAAMNEMLTIKNGRSAPSVVEAVKKVLR